MNFLRNLFGSHQPDPAKTGSAGPANLKNSKVQFDQDGKVTNINLPKRDWTIKRSGQSTYYSQPANSLLHAAEILKKTSSIPGLTYYVVDTPNGSLGMDTLDFYTEAPIKTENLNLEIRSNKGEPVTALGLTGFGNMFKSQTTVATLKKQGQYSRLILLMKCGHCGYESPVETQAGAFARECYCCGTKNNCTRGAVNVIMGSSMVEI